MKMRVEDIASKLGEIGPVFTIDEATSHLNMSRSRVEYYIHQLKEKGILVNAGKRGTYLFTDLRKAYSAKLSRLSDLILDSLRNMSINVDDLENKFKDIMNEASEVYFFEHYLLGSTIVKPSAIAYFSAADYYGWCTRPPNITFIQTPVHRAYKNTVKWADWNVIKIGRYFFKPVTVKPSKFFGFEELEIGGRKVLITDREKTIIDCLDKPKYAGTMEEVLDFLRNAEFDPDKLVEYLRRINNKTLIKRVGYVSEKYDWNIEDKLLNLLSEKDRRSFPLFDPNGPNTGKFDYKWALRINVPEDYWWETKWM